MRTRAFCASLVGMLAGTALLVPSSGAASSQDLLVYARSFRAGGGSALCVSNVAGTRSAILKVFDDRQATSPAWSPDGRRIAFALDGRVVVMDPSTRDVLTVADGTNPSWSPDGSQLAFEGVGGIDVIDVDGTDQRHLTEGHDPDWSPSGASVVFHRPRDEWDPAKELNLIPATGGEVTRLGVGQNGSWSPEGHEIVYVVDGGHSTELRIQPSDGSPYRILLRDDQSPGPQLPSWSPTGTSVLYGVEDASDYRGRYSLWLVNIDGSGRQKIGSRMGPADWGSVPPDVMGLWDRRPCTDPRRSVSLKLDGHLFARGRVSTNDPARCDVAGVTLSFWKKISRNGTRLAGSVRTRSDGSYRTELRPYRRGGRASDVPGRYQAVIQDTDCVRSISAWKVHRH